MAFCESCGQKLNDGVKFCGNCGAETKGEREVKQPERKTVYTGEIQKCPNCGEVLDSFVSTCPSCGMEMRGVKAINSVEELSKQLRKIDEADVKKGFWNNLNNTLNGKSVEDIKREEKANIIRNFPVPNTREDIIEFMILASSNIQNNGENVEAWQSKENQVYEKASLLFGNTTEFTRIKEMHSKNQKINKVGKIKKILPIVLGAIVLVVCIIAIAIGAANESKKQADNENIEAKIEIALFE